MTRNKLIATATLIFIIFVIISSVKSNDAPITTAEQAIGACRVFIKRHANDPSAIDFIYEDAVSTQLQDGTWRATLGYRGKNMFNATIRTSSTCHMEHSQGNWRELEVI